MGRGQMMKMRKAFTKDFMKVLTTAIVKVFEKIFTTAVVNVFKVLMMAIAKSFYEGNDGAYGGHRKSFNVCARCVAAK